MLDFAADQKENGGKCQGGYEAESKQLRNLWKNASCFHRDGHISSGKYHMLVLFFLVLDMQKCLLANVVNMDFSAAHFSSQRVGRP